jgi:hypothetical protein
MQDEQQPLNPPTDIKPISNVPAGGMSSPAPQPKKSFKKPPVIAVIVVLLIATAAVFWWLGKRGVQSNSNATSNAQNNQQSETESTNDTTQEVAGVQLDPNKNYGNKYKDGLLPVGDNKYVTNGAKVGSIYMCNANFVPASQAGAQARGPWFTNNNTQWDINKKAAVSGKKTWTPNFTTKIENGKRVISTNDLPSHFTGIFPVQSSDTAYQYDRNPSTITSQSLTYSLSASPSYGTPQCMGGEVGVMLTGSAIFNGFDAGGRDAGAWEVQDACDGHPQNKGEYHYHTLSRCITDISVFTVIGFALDGFPITGPKVGDNNFLTTSDLDECHGLTSQITLDGKKVTMYHYVMTQDFPYSVSCFRSQAIKPPGQAEFSSSQTTQSQPPTGMQQGGTKPPPPQ